MKESQKIMLQHSEVKIRLLRLYLERYLNILTKSKYCGEIHLYDLFCGEGIYNGTGKGSPIIILETIKNIFYSNKTSGNEIEKFNCLFNDIDENKIKKLQLEITERKLHYSEMGNLKFSQKDYCNILPEVAQEINTLKNQKAFIFIDPYGYKNIKISDIKILLKSNKSEVLLFLPTQFMFRFETKGTPESLIEFIDELIPIEKWPKSDTGIEFIENLTEAFRNKLGPSYYVDSFIISRDLNQFFCLFFFTSHIYGFDKMLEAKWNIDEEEGRGWTNKSENDLFSQVDRKANTDKFEQKLKNFLKVERTNGELYEFRVQNGHLAKHANDILTKFQNMGILISVNADGTPARKSAFYLCYNNYKTEPNKIKLKLK
ncbi:MAG: three-Cys-motif partner protein TcmP [Bacteroidetes bacterium]|nr:three-Cys-motif partner protein TcmP [Bacteroidota bacterium]